MSIPRREIVPPKPCMMSTIRLQLIAKLSKGMDDRRMEGLYVELRIGHGQVCQCQSLGRSFLRAIVAILLHAVTAACWTYFRTKKGKV
jgi:hypothetical protein